MVKTRKNSAQYGIIYSWKYSSAGFNLQGESSLGSIRPFTRLSCKVPVVQIWNTIDVHSLFYIM
jgi:hypothetical protein